MYYSDLSLKTRLWLLMATIHTQMCFLQATRWLINRNKCEPRHVYQAHSNKAPQQHKKKSTKNASSISQICETCKDL